MKTNMSVTGRVGWRGLAAAFLLISLFFLGWAPVLRADWTSLGPDGGYPNILRIDPKNPQVLYGCTTGGIFKTVNGGLSWRAMNVGFLAYQEGSWSMWLAIRGFDIDPRNPNILYAATEQGVFKSVDGGGTWNVINNGFSSYKWLYRANFVKVHPADSSILYASLSDYGLYKSLDGGASWTHQTNLGGIGYMTFDPRNSSVIYANDQKSIDGGKTWKPLGSTLVNRGVYFIVIDPKNSKVLYAQTSRYAGLGGALFKSTDGGDTWTWVRTGAEATRVIDYGDIYSLIVDPTDSKILYASASYWTDGIPRGVFRSADGGSTWKELYDDRTIGHMVMDPAHPKVLYAAAGNGNNGAVPRSGGVIKSIDGGVTWHPANTGFTNLTINSVAFNPKNSKTLYAATSPNGAIKTTDGGTTWKRLSGGQSMDQYPVGAVYVDPKTPDTLYLTSGQCGVGVFKSLNGGNTWSEVFSLGTSKWTQCCLNDVLFNPKNTSTLYASTYYGPGVLISMDGGKTWNPPLMKGLTVPGILDVTALAVDPSNQKVMYVGTRYIKSGSFVGSGMFKTQDGGDNWFAVNTGLTTPSIWSLAIDPKDTDLVYAATNDGVFKTADGGNHWNPINTGLTNLSVSTVRLDPKNSHVIYARTGAGIAMSSNGGASWGPVGSNWWANSKISTFAVDPLNSKVIYAGTSADGIYRNGNAAPDTPHITVSPATLAFGAVKESVPYSKTTAITNTGKADLSITALSFAGTAAADFSAAGCTSPVSAGASCTLTVTLTATSFGPRVATLKIASNDTKNSPLSVALSGQAAWPLISASPLSLSFGTVPVSGSKSLFINVKNKGLSDLVVTSVSSPKDTSFAVDRSGCTTVALNGTCSVKVTFTPNAKGKKSGQVIINSNAKTPHVTVTVTGKGGG